MHPAFRTLAATGVALAAAGVALALTALPVSAQWAAAGRPMTFDDVIALRGVSDAQISPDGRWVAYTVTRADLDQNASDADIWLVSTAGETPVRLTTHKKGDSSPRWSPDGRRIAFISAREEKAQIFLMSAFGGEAERLSENKGGVRQITWSPDGRSIAFTADPEPTPEEEKRIKEKDDAIVVDTNYKFARLWVLDVATHKARMLPTGELVASDPQWSPDGTRLAYTSNPTPKADDGSLSDLWVIDVAGGAPRKLAAGDGSDQSPRWSPDGTQIAYITSAQVDVRQPRLAVVSSAGGAPRFVAPDFLYQPGAATWSADGRTLYFGASVRTRSQLFAVPASGGTPRPLLDAGGVVGGGTLSRDGRLAAFTLATPQRPADVYVATLGSAPAAPRRLTDHNPQVRELALGHGARWCGGRAPTGWRSRGCSCIRWATGRARAIRSVTYVHGGPAGVYTESFAANWGSPGQVLAGQGFAVFYPNPRGSSSYGEPFLRANIRDWGAGDYRDIQTGDRRARRARDRRLDEARAGGMELRRLHDGVDADADEPVQGGGRRGGAHGHVLDVRDERHSAHAGRLLRRRAVERHDGVPQALGDDVHQECAHADVDPAWAGGPARADRPGAGAVFRAAEESRAGAARVLPARAARAAGAAASARQDAP